MVDPIIDAAGLRKTIGGRAVIADVSLSVPEGATVLIRGRSGAGKTTLARLLGLLLTPDEGTLVVDGIALEDANRRDRAKIRRETLGYVFQDFQLVPELTARENAALPQSHVGDTDPAWIDDLLSWLGVSSVASQYPPTLSGGEKQRVALARALANRPSVLLADEPTGQLDPETTETVQDLLFAIQDRFETALVVVSHDTAFGPEFEDRYVLADGTLRREQDPDAERNRVSPRTHST